MSRFATYAIMRICTFAAVCTLSATALAENRTVTLTWKPIKDAVKYELQVARTPQMDPIGLRRELTETSVKIGLPPSTYYYRVRGIDSADQPGPWSDLEGFVVNARAPELISPADGARFAERLPIEGIRLKWRKSQSGTRYRLEIRDDSGVALERGVEQESFEWLPRKAAVYSWRVGQETATGTEWGKPRRLLVADSAIPRDIKIVEKIVEKVVEIQGEAPDSTDEPSAKNATEKAAELRTTETLPDVGRGAGYWLIGRLAQAVAAYSSEDLDSNKVGTGSALVSLASIEFRWRARRAKNARWLLSGSANLEMIRQDVLGTDFVLPRGYARVFYTHGNLPGASGSPWRVGPLIHLQAGRAGIFIARSASDVLTAEALRMSAGIGGVAVYQTGPTLYLSSLLLIRMDFGGEASSLPAPLDSNIGFEAGFGLVLALSDSLMLEGRLRALQENFSWTAAAGGTSSFSETFVVLDAGIGWRF